MLNGVLADQVPVGQAAEILGVSERHVWRILAAYRKEGAAALAHGNRGRSPSNAVPEQVKAQVVALASTRYRGANHTHMTELLVEREGIVLSRSTVRRALVDASIESPRRRRPPRHRVRRQRMPQEGMLVQVDGSHHDWLEDRGPRLVLLIAVDDATGNVPHALFRHEEDAQGYFFLLQGIIQHRGVPLALYSDRHAVFKHPREPRQAPAGPTQFARAMQELGIQQIFARSPEAKGRVERAAGTFQDRLVTELRLAGATTIEEANEVLWSYLPSFNEQFGVPPSQPTISYRSPDGLHVSSILCFKHRRKVARDNTVKFDWHTLQLLPSTDRPSYAGSFVEVQERLDGELVVRHGNSTIPTQEAPPRPGALRALNGASGRDANELGGLLRSLPRYNVKDRKTGTRTNGVSKEKPKPRRQPTPRQKARWKAVQRAKRRGLSLRGIARELGISRNTVRKYVLAKSPPMFRSHAKTRANGSDPQSKTTDLQDSDTTTTDIFAEQLA